MRPLICILVILSAFLLASITPSIAQDYALTVLAVADGTTPPYKDFGRYVALNNNGRAAFLSHPTTGGIAIYAVDSSGSILIDRVTGQFDNIWDAISINDSGAVAYLKAGATNVGIYTSADGIAFTTVADITDGTWQGLGFPSLNNNGQVAFLGQRAEGIGIWRVTGSTITPIDLNRGSQSGYGGVVSLNDSGAVAFYNSTAPYSGGYSAIYRGDGVSVTTIADNGPNSLFTEFWPYPSLNNVGEAAFASYPDAVGAFKGSGGQLTRISDTASHFTNFFDVSTNSSGAVAFHASRQNGDDAVFLGPATTSFRAAGHGDPVLGTIIWNIGFYTKGLNESGQIAFQAYLQDGRQVIVRADPIDPIASLTVNSASIPSGNSAKGTVTLTSAAGPSGCAVHLGTDSALITLPDIVTVPEGQTSTDFTISAAPVASPAAVTITALRGTLKKASLTIQPPALSSLQLIPSTITGSLSGSGKVTLTGKAAVDIDVALSNTNPAATVPDHVTVTAGNSSATFTITTLPVAANTTAKVTATYNGIAKSATLTIRPISVLSVLLVPSSLVGGSISSGTVTLEAAAGPAAINVSLTSSSASAQITDDSGNPINGITIPMGSQTGTFKVHTAPVAATMTAKITATANGRSKSASLTIKPIPVQSITVSPNPVTGGSDATAAITLTAPAAPGDILVALYTSNSAIARFVDSNGVTITSITIPDGTQTVNVTVRTAPVALNKSVTLKATAGGVTKSVIFQITK